MVASARALVPINPLVLPRGEQLIGDELDYWVAQALGHSCLKRETDTFRVVTRDGRCLGWIGNVGPLFERYSPSTDPAQGYPLIVEYAQLIHDRRDEVPEEARYYVEPHDPKFTQVGPTLLVAVTRAVVALHYADALA